MMGREVVTASYTLKNMKCQDLSVLDLEVFGGGSDPYIVLTTDPIELLHQKKSGPIKSSCILHNLNPDWKDETLSFEIVSTDIKSVEAYCHLIVQVWDKDQYTEDDMIGVCTIPFKSIIRNTTSNLSIPSALNSSQKEFMVREDLYFGGKKQGVFECTIVRNTVEHKPTNVRSIGNAQSSVMLRKITLEEYIMNHRANYDSCIPEGCGCIVS